MTLKSDGQEVQFVSLGKTEKLVGISVAILTVVFSVSGAYTLLGYRISQCEKRADANELRITQQEQYGHPDHERRITKLESWADSTDKVMYDVRQNLAVALEILRRLDPATNPHVHQ